jgi:hypothetical protein
MLKKFQHDRDIVKVLNFDCGLWSWSKWLPAMMRDDNKFQTKEKLRGEAKAIED